ncbi:MAG: signal peptidase I [Bacteroidetes bacterium]|nr:signal peptidase I [Bacteroidota bacterium]
MGPLIILCIIYLGILVLILTSRWKIFEKAGKPGWASLVPVYSFVVLLRIVGKPWWWTLLLFIPGVNVIIFIIVIHCVSLSFGKDNTFTAGLILLGFIYIPLLAYSETHYYGPQGKLSSRRLTNE